ncbi:hypothetical protein [Pseudoalteromonas denitrificans]|uniref:Uncharacterized protein n=1 Tax=Pseudoalteromonas denitrificans DSM 6059 TaxID=1123010 RepID=A0A1I1N4Q3_9GAMM|nr:hypothetical protein [Pseudoalteromonas denitrificans]SFC92162.1 hypothetical protein SAMN02745724_02922 [Pseudoalteromonas denitrificans DSM 6059]
MEKFKSIVYLIFTFFGFFFLLMTPFQFYEVYQTSDATPLKAQVIHSSFGKDSDGCWFELEVKVIETENIIEIRDFEPGDISTCSSMKSNKKLLYKGKKTTIFITKEGDYYASKGSYLQVSIIGTLSIVWYLHLFYLARRNKKTNTQA